jgi:pyridoxine 4-dehydrogenase
MTAARKPADAPPRPVVLSGTARLGRLTIRRLGFGAARLTGDGIWGDPPDRQECVRVLQRAVELGVNFIDTAGMYGPYVSEELIRTALHPYPDDLVIASKAGVVRWRPGPGAPLGRPEFLRYQCETSLRRLGLDTIDMFFLHRIDPAVPADEQFGLLKELQEEGKVREVGLSQVSIEQIEAARQIVHIAAVENEYSVTQRQDEPVLEHCQRHAIAFVPWYPLASGRLAPSSAAMHSVTSELGCTVPQAIIAWLLARSPSMVPIPGTRRVEHLEENCAAAALRLSADQMLRLTSER